MSATFTTTPQLVDAMATEAAHLRKQIADIVSSCPYINQEQPITNMEKVLQKGFEKSEGPFVKALDSALSSFNVERQAYYSGTFVGNHVHLKVSLHCTTKCI